MRKEFELTEQELQDMLDATKPLPVLLITGGQMGSDSQERANVEWAKLGKKHGFAYMTVESVVGKGDRFFTAEVAR